MVRKIAIKAATGFKSKPSCPGLTYLVEILAEISESHCRRELASLRSSNPPPRGRANRPQGCSVVVSALAIGGTGGRLARAPPAEPRRAIAMPGAPALPEGFTRLPYADPAAPKGGRLVQGVLGTFDSLNPL